MIGRSLSHYEIQEELSRGGMGVVYRALDTKLDRDVALKVLPLELVADEARLRRFVQEAKAAASIHHPHIATIYEIDHADGVHFIAMELIDGEKLSDVVARGPVPVSRVLELATEMAEGLSKAHEKGVVHRDLKPANTMVTEDGHVKIIDFGLAKLVDPVAKLDRVSSQAETGLRGETDPGQILGTVSYMSPEQARGETVDHRTDIFSFGVVLYEMLTGKLPFQGKTGTDTLSAILRDPTPRLSSLTGAGESQMQHVLDRCLAKEPDERYQTAKDLLAELKRLKRDSGERRANSGDRQTTAKSAVVARSGSARGGAGSPVAARTRAFRAARRPDDPDHARAPPRIGCCDLTGWGSGGLRCWPSTRDEDLRPASCRRPPRRSDRGFSRRAPPAALVARWDAGSVHTRRGRTGALLGPGPRRGAPPFSLGGLRHVLVSRWRIGSLACW